jgi:3,4-dihydroxy 2-butanone 4-phosphate synthase/GTP cyclohydrolase II
MKKNPSHFHSIEEALEDLRQGKMIIVVDDEDRENEGDFVMCAENVTADSINFMATYGRGIICAPITMKRAYELELDYMVKTEGNTSNFGTPFTVTIDLAEGNSTGISCDDRARTIRSLTKPHTRAQDFVRPGHVFPLIAQDQGVLQRRGHTEAAVDLAKLAGLYPAGVICEIMNDDGSMARVPDLQKLAQKFQLKMVTIADLVTYRLESRPLMTFSPTLPFPSLYGQFDLILFGETPEDEHRPHMAFIKSSPSSSTTPESPKIPLVRIHSECMTGDLFGSQRCDCGDQLKLSLELLQQQEFGLLFYLRQEGRGIGLTHKIQSYSLQDQGYDTVSANLFLGHDQDLRQYSMVATFLKTHGWNKIKILTNNPHKVNDLTQRGIEIVQRIPLEIKANSQNYQYMKTKKEKMGHWLNPANPNDPKPIMQLTKNKETSHE